MEPYDTIKDYLDHAPQDEVNGLIEFMQKGRPTWEEYVNNFQDLIDAGVQNGLQHFLYHGWKEGRLIPRGFDLAPSTVVGNWKPPTASGWHDITGRVPGGFFMGGCRTATGLRIGTYRPAKWYEFDGALKLAGSGPQESFYSFYKNLITTEYPAGVWDGTSKRWEGTGSSLAFDIHEISGGLSLFTLNTFGGDTVTMMKSVDGQCWNPYATVKGHLIQCYSDGNQERLVGEKDGFPYICNLQGQKVMQDSSYRGQMINFACFHKGVAVLGCNSIGPFNPEDGSRRNGYLTYWDGTHHIAGKYPDGRDANCVSPYIMNIKQDPEKEWVYAVASIWNETGYPNPELVKSIDGKNWGKLCSVPMPSAQTIEICDSGIYCYGGKYGEYGEVKFLKF
jgi:hypothetical protein